MSERLDHGGWVLVPTKEVVLPKVVLTPEQITENIEAEVRHRQTCAQIDNLIAQIQALGGSAPVDGDDDDSIPYVYPDLRLPHDPEAYDFTKFGPKEWAYAAFLDETRFQGLGPTEKIARELVKHGLKMTWSFQGMSVGQWPINSKDAPPLPEWAK